MNEFMGALVCEQKNELIPDGQDLFGSLIGAWDFEWTDCDLGGERHVQGEWLFARVLDGMGVQDVFICPSRKMRRWDKQPDAAYGTTLRLYNPRTEAWDVFYGESGVAVRLEARRAGDEIVLTEMTEGRMKWIFSKITDTSFRWCQIRTDDGETWRETGGLRAVRRK